MYIPYLSREIIDQNEVYPFINLKGIMMGNPVLIRDRAFMDKALYTFLYKHNLIPESLLDDLIEACTENRISDRCMGLNDDLDALIRKILIYDIYGYCFYSDKYILLDYWRHSNIFKRKHAKSSKQKAHKVISCSKTLMRC